MAKEMLRVEAPDTSSLDDLKILITSKLSLMVPLDSIQLFLNYTNEILSPSPGDSLPSLSLTSGDLLLFSFTPDPQTLSPTTAPISMPPRSPSPSSAAIPISGTAPSPSPSGFSSGSAMLASRSALPSLDPSKPLAVDVFHLAATSRPSPPISSSRPSVRYGRSENPSYVVAVFSCTLTVATYPNATAHHRRRLPS